MQTLKIHFANYFILDISRSPWSFNPHLWESPYFWLEVLATVESLFGSDDVSFMIQIRLERSIMYHFGESLVLLYDRRNNNYSLYQKSDRVGKVRKI